MSAKRYVALLRGINVGGHNKVPMAELREVCTGLGWEDVTTYIQSGNVVFTASGAAKDLEAQLEAGIEKHFGLSIAVVVRDRAAWSTYVAGNPFPEACESEPKLVMLGLAKKPLKADAAEKLQERADAGERLAQVGEALWSHYPEGVARSKLSPALTDRLAGSSVTARNWRTVLKLAEMLDEG